MPTIRTDRTEIRYQEFEVGLVRAVSRQDKPVKLAVGYFLVWADGICEGVVVKVDRYIPRSPASQPVPLEVIAAEGVDWMGIVTGDLPELVEVEWWTEDGDHHIYRFRVGFDWVVLSEDT